MTATDEGLFFLTERFGRGPETPYEERFACTDAGNAELFAWLNRDQLRFDHKRSRWLQWAGHWWREDTTEQVVQLAIRAARYRFHQAESIVDLEFRKKIASWAVRSEGRARIDARLALARSMWPVGNDGEGWDDDPWLLGVENGVIELRNGVLRPGRQDDGITRHAPVHFDATATSPMFDSFLGRVQPDPAMRAYLQRRAGYALTADVSEQDLAFFYGEGANGKTTFANGMMDVLGPDYARPAAPDLLLRSYGERHPTEVADLDGARLVISSEVEEGRVLAERLLKDLTGGDKLKARRMRQDFYEFDPTFKILLLANHKPAVKGTDWAIWRRIRLIPWNVTIPDGEKDPHLRDRLRQENPGILNWMIAGCLDWQREGMKQPQEVSAATEAYRTESDPLGAWLSECAVIGDGFVLSSAAAFRSYQSWANAQGITERGPLRLNSTTFGTQMGIRFTGRHTRKGKTFSGIGLLVEHQEVLSGDGFGSDVTGLESEPHENRVAALTHSSHRDESANPSHPSPSHETGNRQTTGWEEALA